MKLGKRSSSESLTNFLSQRKSGDSIVCTSLDRFSRNYHWTVRTINELYSKNVHIISLNLNNSYLTAGKQLHEFYLSILEAEKIAKKNEMATKIGISNQKQKGDYKGRPFKLDFETRAKLKKALDQKIPTSVIEKRFKINRVTLWRYR